jgi:hypothetical protein
MKTLIHGAAALCALLLSTSAYAQDIEAEAAVQLKDYQRPDQRRIAFELDAMQVHAADSSTKAIDKDGVFTGSVLGVAWAPLVQLPQLRGVFMFQGIGNDPDEQRFNGELNASWSRQRFMLGADIGQEFLGFLRPSARVAAGYSLQQLEIGPDAISDYTHDIALQGSLGLEAFLDLWRLSDLGDDEDWGRLRLGMRYQWGWSWQSAAQFDELRDRSDDAQTTWKTDDVNLGSLNTDGMFWTLGLNLSYAL